MDVSSFFTRELLDWFSENARELPWKKNKDPYTIWLSEIILQQTRVEQGTPYFLKFIKAYPTVKDMALAEQDEILSLWEGLGYYSRARNMHYTAQYIYRVHDGIFPTKYDDILRLKGIGPYTAAAICSFAYDEARPVVDGNVIRVLSRYFGINDFVDETSTKKQIQLLAEQCIDKNHPSSYNQAIMDFGSLVCTPKNTACKQCVMSVHCLAYQFDQVQEIPKKSKKIKKRHRYFHFFVISDGKSIVLEKRAKKDIWLALYQYPLIELEKDQKIEESHVKKMLNPLGITSYDRVWTDDLVYKQTLTHQYIHARFYHIHVNESIKSNSIPYYLVDFKNLRNFAFPRVVNDYPLTEEMLKK